MTTDVTTTGGMTGNYFQPMTNTVAAGTAGTAGTTDTTTTGGTANVLDPSQSTLSPNFAQYVYDMLTKGQTAANLPYQNFTGQRFAFGTVNPATGMYEAGYSPLETDAFAGLKALGDYDPTEFSSGYTAPKLSDPTQFGNQFTAPGAYNPTQFTTGLGALGSIQDYMSPYQSAVTDVEAREARRQADISRTAEQARLAQAGAFGGSRQAIMEAERQRNLGTQIGDITSKGLQGAYDRAVKQRFEEAGLNLDAQRATEASKQFAATQGMTAAQLAAQYGLSAKQAEEAARQFQAQQNARSAEFSATQGLEAQRLGESAKQFGANYGLGALRDQLAAGAEQRRIAQEPLDFGYSEWLKSVDRPKQQAREMQDLLAGLPLQATAYQPEQSALVAALQGLLAASGLAKVVGG
jgi:hypothetical protein